MTDEQESSPRRLNDDPSFPWHGALMDKASMGYSDEVRELCGQFGYQHLPEKLADVSWLYCKLAYALLGRVPKGSSHLERSLVELLRSKDDAVRALRYVLGAQPS